MAQLSGGRDLCGHSLSVFQGLSLGGAKRPTVGRCACPGGHSHLLDPHHGEPCGAEDQEWGWKLLIILTQCSPDTTLSTSALLFPPTWGLLFKTGTAAALLCHPGPCREVTQVYQHFTTQRNSETSATDEAWTSCPVSSKMFAAVQCHTPQCETNCDSVLSNCCTVFHKHF